MLGADRSQMPQGLIDATHIVELDRQAGSMLSGLTLYRDIDWASRRQLLGQDHQIGVNHNSSYGANRGVGRIGASRHSAEGPKGSCRLVPFWQSQTKASHKQPKVDGQLWIGRPIGSQERCRGLQGRCSLGDVVGVSDPLDGIIEQRR